MFKTTSSSETAMKEIGEIKVPDFLVILHLHRQEGVDVRSARAIRDRPLPLADFPHRKPKKVFYLHAVGPRYSRFLIFAVFKIINHE